MGESLIWFSPKELTSSAHVTITRFLASWVQYRSDDVPLDAFRDTLRAGATISSNGR
jgi:hypothetical protein